MGFGWKADQEGLAELSKDLALLYDVGSHRRVLNWGVTWHVLVLAASLCSDCWVGNGLKESKGE